jgi:16S rRNA (cytosine967-C5)-methyltransferase
MPKAKPVSNNTRAQAARILAKVIEEGQSLTAVLERQDDDGRDAALLRELCYGVLRHVFSLSALTEQLLSKSLKAKDADVRCLIMVGLYQLIHLRVPDHAAINETVAATKTLKKPWAKGLINALLRRYQRESDSLLQKVGDDARYEHPTWLLARLRADWPEDWRAIIEGNNARAPMTLRVNVARGDRDTYLADLKANDIDAQPIEDTGEALQLSSPAPVESLPGFAEGRVSVQDAAAQLAAGLLAAEPGQRILDACAAPGGKTAHILEGIAAQGGEADLLAIDNDERRMSRVAETLDRLELSAELCVADAADVEAWFEGEPFDRILLDAPCSATGVIRRHPDIKCLRRDTDIDALVAIQAGLLDRLWTVLKPGGRMLYATCSVLRAENVAQMEAFLSRQEDAKEQPIEANWGHKQTIGRQILPGEADKDGFYYALLEKSA